MSITFNPIQSRITVNPEDMSAVVRNERGEPMYNMRFVSKEAMVSIINCDFSDDRSPVTQFWGGPERGVCFQINDSQSFESAAQFISEEGEIISAQQMREMLEGREIVFQENR